uniref:Uncharacterized protein n=1 Tax=Leersia perrieri TaxID=77586 RepID=A0A0D9WB84_9ORYZ
METSSRAYDALALAPSARDFLPQSHLYRDAAALLALRHRPPFATAAVPSSAAFVGLRPTAPRAVRPPPAPHRLGRGRLRLRLRPPASTARAGHYMSAAAKMWTSMHNGTLAG